MTQVKSLARTQRWEDRLFPGLRVASVPADIRSALAQVLGVLGVEAEHFLGIARAFTAGDGASRHSREQGELFLWQMEASALRLRDAASAFEMATQAYLAALEEHQPEVRARSAQSGGVGDGGGPWWPEQESDQITTQPLDLCLRRCGFSYRHAVAARLAANVEATGEHLALLLHALNTLPPAGVLPAETLYDGLYELAAGFQGHVVPHLLGDISPELPGLVTGVHRLQELDRREDRSIRADLTWARAQLDAARAVSTRLPAAPERPARPGLFGLGALLRRTPGRSSRTNPTTPRAWADLAEREWQTTISALEALRTQDIHSQSGQHAQ